MMRDPYEIIWVLAAGFFYILFAGAYAFSYTIFKMNKNPFYKQLAIGFLLGMLYCAYILMTNGIFDPFWKWLIGIATTAYIFIPFGMWKVVIKIHEHERELKRRERGLQ
ncbi:MAG: hypothetical protein DSY42_05465 [Aquifex sp.]|nr:MAG: hypothetical protein DSY42_05465 [Aquifex sp.]